MKKLTYFVPVDFSDCSYNALQYAIMLARTSGGEVKLSHVIDLDELPESENPVVVNWNLDRLNRRAKGKMNSLREIVSMEGVTVEDDIQIGNVPQNLLKQIHKINPHIIVVGRNTESEPGRFSMVSYITRNTKIPVLVVPGSHNPTLPTRAVLATNKKPDRVAHYAPLLNLLKNTSQELAVMAVGGSASGEQSIKEWIADLNNEHGIKAQFIPRKNGSTTSLTDFIRTNKVDLLCTIREHGFFGRLFGRNEPGLIPQQVGVPVLMINK